MNKENTKDELDEFFVDEDSLLDKGLIASIMKPFVQGIGPKGTVEFKDSFEKLAYWKKILVYLVCRKALLIRAIVKEEGIGPKDIADAIRISESSAKKLAVDDNLKKFSAGKNGKYYIPNYKLIKVKEILI